MKDHRKHGNKPYKVILVHGGPGARDEMFSVARQLSARFGIIEALQCETTLQGQIDELATVISQHAESPVVLLGHSWGAWLSLLMAAMRPELVNKLILVGCGPLEEKYATEITATRLQRLGEKDGQRFERLLTLVSDRTTSDSDLAELGRLAGKADSFHPEKQIPGKQAQIDCKNEMFADVWEEASAMRRDGGLTAIADKLRCPVLAIHGDYDPHPAQGVKQPLSERAEDFRFILLEKCGHKPWIEAYARKEFYEILDSELENYSTQ